ncbi:MAG: 6-bladed beta-propeller [Balneolaceae bacterium]
MNELLKNEKLYLVVLGVLFFGSCSGEPEIEIPEEISALENATLISSDATPLHNSEPVIEATYGDTDEIIIGRIGPFTVGNNGNVYLSDVSRQVIHVYSADGTHIEEIGGEGDGPGEFRRISSVSIDEKTIHVLDTQQMRISRFDVNNFRYIDDMELPFEPDYSGGYFTYPQSLDVMNDGNHLIHFGMGFSSGQEDQETSRSVIGKKFDIDKGVIEPDTMYSFPASEALVRRDGTSLHMMASVPYKRSAHVHYKNGEIMHGWSEEPLFKWFDEDGEYTRAVYSPYENEPLLRNDIVKEYEDRDEPWRGMIRNDDHPETWPSFIQAIPDDEGRVWVGLITDDPDIYTWKSFSLDGEVYASFTWPRHIEINRVQNGEIYTMETDPETDLRQVAKYRLP